jgi:small subunit ribosomal protein S16
MRGAGRARRPVASPDGGSRNVRQMAIGESARGPLYCVGFTEEEFRVLTIRLTRIGKKKHPFYRVVVTEKTRPRNGRFVEIVGTYDPLRNPSAVQISSERVQYWLSKGAQPSDTVRSLLRNRKPA